MTYSAPTASASATATVCDNLATYGGSPERDELDPRPIWDVDWHHSSDHALAGTHSKNAADIFADSMTATVIQEIMDLAAEHLTSDGTQLADEREPLLWGLVNVLHAQMQRLDRTVDRITPEMRDLQSAQDGSEVRANELELVTDRAQNLGDRRDAFELMRDHAANVYQHITTNVWRPRYGSHTSQTRDNTQAKIEARDYLDAREKRTIQAHLPDGTLIAIAGGKTVTDADAIWKALDKVRAKYLDMVAVHGDGPGVEKIAARWAEARGVAQVVCRPNWNAHGKAAPFRRNDDIINLLPKGLIAFPGSGITANLVDKARQARIPVMEIAA